MIDTTVFDRVAAGYDSTFTHTSLGRLVRRRVWRLLTPRLRPRQRVLELACGTGEDALWLARQGVQVVATDGAAEMVRLARQKVRQAELEERVQVHHCSLQQLVAGPPSWATDLDGVFSNFGGLNTINAWGPLAQALAGQVQQGGWALLVVMGPVCPWEIGWHLLHGQIRRAGRRLRQPAQARVGGQTIPIWYPSPRQLARAFMPWFRAEQTWSLGLWLPPTYLGHLIEGRPRLAATLSQIEQATAPFTAGWGDHYILLLRRTKEAQWSRS